MRLMIRVANNLLERIRISIAFSVKVGSKFFRKRSLKDVHTNKNLERISVADLIVALERHGVRGSDAIFVHSSFKALGRFCEKPGAIITAFKSWVGEGGTIMFPAFTATSTSYDAVAEATHFDLDTLKITTGVLPAFAAKDPEFIRTLHPTHSVVGYGKCAQELLRDHGIDGTATGIHSPFYKMAEYSGKIINLGVGLNQTTAVHMVEETPGIFFPIESVSVQPFEVSVTYGGRTAKVYPRPLRRNLFLIRDVDRIKDALKQSNGLVEFTFGNGVVQVIDAKILREVLTVLALKGETIYGRWLY